jgi:HAD superfamily hydrolase (TIGR01509 family)
MTAVHIGYGQVLLRAAGLPSDPDTVLRVMQKTRGGFSNPHFALYDDVLPALEALKSRGLVMGLISNIDRDIRPVCCELGLDPYITHVVTSGNTGSEKPRPPIFLAALKKAGVKAADAVYVGDQPDCDVVGARGVGMKPVLVDRYDLFPGTVDCPRLRSLAELADHV